MSMVAMQASFDPFTRTPSGGRSRRRPRSERESALLALCIEYLRLRGVFCWRQNSGALRGKRENDSPFFVRFSSIHGISDILGVLAPSGKLLACEVKVKPNKATPEQLEFIDAVNRSGGVGIVVCALAELDAAITAATAPQGTVRCARGKPYR